MKRETFAARLARLREAAKLTAYALAKVAGVDESYVRRLERGQQQPSLEVARKLTLALGESLAIWDDMQAS